MFQELMNKKIIKKRIRRNRKTLITGLIAVGVALVIGVLCLCIALFMNSRASKAAAAAALPTPTPTPVQTAAPAQASDPAASPDAETGDESAQQAGTDASGTAASTAESATASTPKPATSTAAGPTITKNPYSETVTAGGWVVFLARANNYKTIEWRIVSADAKTSYDMETASQKFGFWYTGSDTEAITIGSVLLTLDGWQIQACFTDKQGNSSYTDFAQFHVVKPTQW